MKATICKFLENDSWLLSLIPMLSNIVLVWRRTPATNPKGQGMMTWEWDPTILITTNKMNNEQQNDQLRLLEVVMMVFFLFPWSYIWLKKQIIK